MQLYVTSNNPKDCAIHLDNSRIGRAIVNNATMLSEAIYYYNPELDGKFTKLIYPNRKINHPLVRWTGYTIGNYTWVLNNFFWLLHEYDERKKYDTHHPCRKMLPAFRLLKANIPDGPRTKYLNHASNKKMGISFREEFNILNAYRKYLNTRWKNAKHKPMWGAYDNQDDYIAYLEEKYKCPVIENNKAA